VREEAGEHFTGPSDTYFFTHDKIRDVVYTEAGEARRRIFHRRALDVLQAALLPLRNWHTMPWPPGFQSSPSPSA